MKSDNDNKIAQEDTTVPTDDNKMEVSYDVAADTIEVKTKKKATKKAKKQANKTSKTTGEKSGKKKIKKKKSAKKKADDSLYVQMPKYKSHEPETVSEELQKITNIKSMEQLKRPKRIAFMIGFYVLLFIAAIIFCMIWFSKAERVKKDKMFDYDYNFVEQSSDDIRERYILDTSIEESSDEKTIEEKVLETSKTIETKATIETKTTKETLKAVREITTVKNQTEIDKKKEIAKEEVISMKTNTRDKDAVYDFEKEIYSSATYYQYSLLELNNIKARVATLYESIKDKVFGNDVTFDDKGKNGIMYLNFTNLNDFIKNKTDTSISEYDSLIPVERLSGELEFNFASAIDRGIYYDVPANNGQRSITMKILKGAKIGFSKDYNLTATLEILDIECGTKINTYFEISEIIGKNPKYKGILPDSGFNIDEALKIKKFNYVIYDKKGYITDLMCLG